MQASGTSNDEGLPRHKLTIQLYQTKEITHVTTKND